MTRTGSRARWRPLVAFAAASIVLAADSAAAVNAPADYAGKPARIGNGTAHTLVRTSPSGEVTSISVVFTAGVLKGLPKATKGGDPDFPYLLPMPTRGPRTVVDHVVINWESAGHPPPHVYDVPHFDFHFYLVSEAEQMSVSFNSATDSGDPAHQPPAELLPAGYVVPPGTAVPRMGVHAINPAGAEFHEQPFTATFIYGYHNRQQTFIEPMASLAFLASKPSFSAPVPRPGAYPAVYSIRYDAARKMYEVGLEQLREGGQPDTR